MLYIISTKLEIQIKTKSNIKNKTWVSIKFSAKQPVNWDVAQPVKLVATIKVDETILGSVNFRLDNFKASSSAIDTTTYWILTHPWRKFVYLSKLFIHIKM